MDDFPSNRVMAALILLALLLAWHLPALSRMAADAGQVRAVFGAFGG